MTTDNYEILAIKYAEQTNRKRAESFISADDHDAPHPIDYFVWVVRNEHRTIVIDTGFDETEALRRDRQLKPLPVEALSLVGVAADVTPEVVITHPHYDHAGSLAAFTNARFHVQAAEMAYATGPYTCHAHLQWPFTAEHVCEVAQGVFRSCRVP
jgi:glyoxylase-like metal-dependent hydrolase (beta-lactamase superfamily II)